MQSLKTLLYASRLAEQQPPSAVGAITRRARVSNHQRGIRGLLIFDGARFAQWLDGPAAEIEALLPKLQHDARHVDMRVLSLREAPRTSHFCGWDLGYLALDDEDGEAITPLARLEGAAAEQAFLALAAIADRGGGMALADPR